MKKIYLSILTLSAASLLNAQVQQNAPMKKSLESSPKNVKPVLNQSNEEKATPLWTNDFSAPGDWSIYNNTGDAQDWVITNASNTTMGYSTGSWVDDLNDVTNENGYALFDSDAVGSNGGTQEAYIEYIGTGVDFSLYPNVVIEFAQRGRMWQNTQTIVQVSNDGGSTWNDFEVNLNKETSITFEEFTSVNVSSAAGSQANVTIRFKYIGSWDYMWAVDDVAFYEQPADDIQTVSAYFVGANNESMEYGRNHINNIDNSWTVGGQVYNFGSAAQTGVQLTAAFTGPNALNYVYTAGSPLASADTVALEGTETPTLSVGTYTGTYTSVSDNETAGANFGNNTFLRNFAVTDDLYSVDGIDIYPAANSAVTSLGTPSFTGGEDGLILATMYHIRTNTQVDYLEVALSASTVAGGDIIASIIDTANFFANDMTPVFQSAAYTVQASDVTNGYAHIPFTAPITLTPGAYFAAVELYSNGNANDIRVLDDVTVPQPYYASMIYIPADAAYSNGTALAIRLHEFTSGLNEISLEGVSVYPNPSTGLVNISNDKKINNTIVVYDMLGNEVISKVANTATTIDLSAAGTGVYLVKVSNENGSKVERVVIK